MEYYPDDQNKVSYTENKGLGTLVRELCEIVEKRNALLIKIGKII